MSVPQPQETWLPVVVGDAGVEVRTTRATPASGRRLWPSIGEYPVYDDLFYQVMVADLPRNEPFSRAVAEQAAGRAVLELGSGPDLLWSSLAAECGARSVVAVEVIPASAEAAGRRAARLGPHVSVVHGDATRVALAERAELCVAELVGAIGGSEGIDAIIEDAWRRNLAPDAVVVPHRVRSPIAAVSARDLLAGPPALHPLVAPYLGDVFRSVDSVFDVRMCVTGLTADDLDTTCDLLEDLRLGEGAADHPSTVRMEVTRPARLDSCLVWLELQCAAGQPYLDSLATTTNWMPVLVPFAAEDPVPVGPGDVLALEVTMRRPDAVHPEWWFDGAVEHVDGSMTPVTAASAYAGGPLRASWLHRALFRPRDQHGESGTSSR